MQTKKNRAPCWMSALQVPLGQAPAHRTATQLPAVGPHSGSACVLSRVERKATMVPYDQAVLTCCGHSWSASLWTVSSGASGLQTALQPVDSGNVHIKGSCDFSRQLSSGETTSSMLTILRQSSWHDSMKRDQCFLGHLYIG